MFSLPLWRRNLIKLFHCHFSEAGEGQEMVNLPFPLTSFPLIDLLGRGGGRWTEEGAACSWQSVHRGLKGDLTFTESPLFPVYTPVALIPTSLGFKCLPAHQNSLDEPPSTLLLAGDRAAGHFCFLPRSLLHSLFYLSGARSLSLKLGQVAREQWEIFYIHSLSF